MNEANRACSTNGRVEKCIQGFGGETRGKEPLGRPKYRWEDDIKMHLQEMGCGVVHWTELAQDSDRWRGLVNVVMNSQAP
jgi:hypothetical protein